MTAARIENAIGAAVGDPCVWKYRDGKGCRGRLVVRVGRYVGTDKATGALLPAVQRAVLVCNRCGQAAGHAPEGHRLWNESSHVS